jgi:hypothetical protein
MVTEPYCGGSSEAYFYVVMKVKALHLLIPLLLVCSAPPAKAQQPAVGVGAVAPRISAPAPHSSPPASSFAPRPSLPSLPPSSFVRPAIPNGAGPRPFTPRFVAPGQHRWLTPDGAEESLRHNPEHGMLSQVPNAKGGLVLSNPTFAGTARHLPNWSLARSTFRGNFAESRLAKVWDDRRHHHRPFIPVLGAVGLLFWPYAFSDLIDFTFWPYAYDTFWPQAYDDIFVGIYGAYAPQYYVPANGQPNDGDESNICLGPANRFIDLPMERIARQIEPDPQQKLLLDDLKAATAKAVTILRNACPSELASTPTGRLAAMRQRVEAMLQTVKAVRPALEAFYQSITDEQKERFNAIDQDTHPAHQLTDVNGLCGDIVARKQALPLEEVNRRLKLTSEQQLLFRDVNDASARAAEILKATCHPEDVVTPTARLAAMEDRLNGVLEAVNTVQTPLENFYQSLDDEQKARFNRLGDDQPHAFDDLDLHPTPLSRKLHPSISICRC